MGASGGPWQYIVRRVLKLHEMLMESIVKLAGSTIARHMKWLYQKELPGDRSKLIKVFTLLEQYSGFKASQIEPHLKRVRDKAFTSFPYPSIGRWRFMDFYITDLPEYPTIISRLKAGDALLDVGCCFGHILRQMVFDGAPSSNLAGTDLRPEFMDLGYELFRDADKFQGRFVTGNIFDDADTGLATFDGKFDMIHAAAFFHLFSWEDQIRVGERMVRWFKPEARALIVGRQIGAHEPLSVAESEKAGNRAYQHNVETMQRMWDVIGAKTGSRWKVSGTVFDSAFDGLTRTFVQFAVAKV